MDKNLNAYLTQMLPVNEEWVGELEQTAKDERIPIMDPQGINFIMQLIRLNNSKRILEIGTAIGYSALRMAESNPESTVVTIEKDEQRYQQAIHNIEKLGMENKIQVIHGDALEVLNRLTNEYLFDMVFIDASKGKYKQFFELSSPLLSENGFIVSDNVLFKGYVADPGKENSRLQNIAEKVRKYNNWLIQHPGFTTTIVPIGDGVAVSTKK